MSKTSKITLIPVMLCFFAMGFVDLVGIASNFVKQDLSLSDSVANILPSLVFFWFLIFSVPTGVLMNKIGRKKTVLLSLVVTVVSLLLPIVSENFYVMLVSFSLLGIGNTLMQTSLNPLVSTVIKGHQGQPGRNTHLRTVCQGHRLVHGSIHCHVGCRGHHSQLRPGLAHPLPGLYGGGHRGHPAAGLDAYRGGACRCVRRRCRHPW